MFYSFYGGGKDKMSNKINYYIIPLIFRSVRRRRRFHQNRCKRKGQVHKGG